MTDITTRLLSMSEAMWMDRDQDEIDALLLEAKGEIERLREAKPFANAIYNDNGDITVDLSVQSEDLIKAYFVLRRGARIPSEQKDG